MPSGVRVWEVLSVLDGGHGRFTQRALLHRTPRMRLVNWRCGLGVANETHGAAAGTRVGSGRATCDADL